MKCSMFSARRGDPGWAFHPDVRPAQPVFLQKARVFMHADKTEKLCKALAEQDPRKRAGPDRLCRRPGNWRLDPGLRDLAPSRRSRRSGSSAKTASSGCGGSRLKRARASSLSKTSSPPACRSARPSTACARSGAKVVAAACIIDRSAGKADVGVPLVCAGANTRCRPIRPTSCRRSLPPFAAIKPGSRHLGKK